MAITYPQLGPQWFTAKAFALVLPLLIAACANREDDCHYTLTCGDFSVGGTTGTDAVLKTGGTVGTGGDSSIGGTGALGGTSSSGSGGITSATSDSGGSSSAAGGSSDAGFTSDTGGAVATGGSSDTGGTVGTGGSSDTGGTLGTVDSGMGGSSSALGGVSSFGGIGDVGGGGGTGGVIITCDPPCQGQKPACLQSSRTCVQCLGNEHCSSPKPYCDPVTYTCGECLSEGQCSGTKSHCDLAKDTCVECTGDTQCSGTKSHCDLSKNACVECTGDPQCSGSKPYCDLNHSTCVECLDSADCTSPSASVCAAGKCSPCATNSDCSHITGKGVCDTTFVEPDAGTESGTCVQCTGNDYAACSPDDAGPAQVCDSLKKACTDIDEHTATVCEPCVSDAQCQSGKLCVEEKFNNVSVGHFCFFDEGSATQSCASLAPYVQYLNGNTSIDGKNANICGLAASTCTAMNLYRKQTCAPNGTPDDSLCGVAPGVDSKCLPWASGSSVSYYCSVACITSVDCKNGLACKPLTGSTKSFCAFQ